MAKKRIGNFRVVLGATTSAFTSGLHRARAAMSAFGKSVRPMAAAVSAASKRMAGIGAKIAGLATALAGGGMAFLLKRAADAGDAVGKLSERIGISTESLSGLQRAAKLTGASVTILEKGLVMMTRNVSEAAAGTGEAIDAINDLGLNAQALNRLAPDAVFNKLAAAMSGVANQSDRVRIASDIFGARGIKLLNTLQLGTRGLREINNETGRFGLAISRLDASRFAEFNDTLQRTREVFTGIATQMAGRVAPLITELGKRFIAVATDGDGLAAKIDRVMNSIASAAGGAADFVQSAWTTTWKNVEIGFSLLAQGLLGTIKTIAGNIADALDNALLRTNPVLRTHMFLLRALEAKIEKINGEYFKGTQELIHQKQELERNIVPLSQRIAKILADITARNSGGVPSPTRIPGGLADRLAALTAAVTGPRPGGIAKVAALSARSARFASAEGLTSGKAIQDQRMLEVLRQIRRENREDALKLRMVVRGVLS